MKQYSDAMRSYAALALVFLFLIVVLPANKVAMRQYHLSTLQYHILIFLVVLPLMILWFAAFFCYGQLKRYALAVAKTKEGDHFMLLARGCQWLAWSLPLSSIISIILSSIANSHAGFKASATIIDDYVALIFPLIAFTILNTGSRGLVDTARLRMSSKSIKLIVSIFVAFGVLYCFMTFRQLSLHDTTSTDNPFFLPTWLLVSTITFPYLYAWFTGLLAAYDIGIYGKRTHGVLYNRPSRILALGIGLIVAGSILLQYITSIEPRALHLSLDGLLVVGYAVRLISGVGYGLTALGAIRLRKIEEV